jgi:hypothetical protein
MLPRRAAPQGVARVEGAGVVVGAEEADAVAGAASGSAAKRARKTQTKTKSVSDAWLQTDRPSNNLQDDDNSDVSDSYTPLPTRTKSGRNIKQPVVFVPTLPEPSQGNKRRKSTKALLAAKCKVCRRDVDPSNNRIVFCDACSTAYHQYCHKPSISNDVVTVLEKEWLCGPCQRSKETVHGADELVAAENISLDEVRLPLPPSAPIRRSC